MKTNKSQRNLLLDGPFSFLGKKGASLLEVLIAMAFFAIAIATMALILFPFIAGSRTNTYRPHTDRIALEVLSRKLDADFNTFGPIFVFEGEVLDSTSSWITPNPLTLNLGTPGELTQDNFLTRTGLTASLNQDNDPANYRAYTLIFLSPEGGIDEFGRYIIHMDVVYRMSVSNDPLPPDTAERISYRIERLRRDDGTPDLEVGVTDKISFTAEGLDEDGNEFLMSNPDQELPYFKPDGDQIKVLLPNPFSKRVVNSLTSAETYLSPLKLIYNLAFRGANGVIAEE